MYHLNTIYLLRFTLSKLLFSKAKGLLLGALFLGLICSAPISGLAQTETDVPIEVSGDELEYVRPESKIVATGNVIITYKNVKMTCDRAEVFSESKKAYAEGHVYIYQESGEVVRGEKVYYDFKNSQGSFPNGEVISEPWHGSGEQIEQISKDEIRIYNAKITTCAYDRPHYDVKAKRVNVYPGNKIVARDVTFRVLGKTVLWWPYLVLPLNTNEPPFEIAPGYSSDDGFYVLTSKTTSISKNLKVKAHLDYRSKRGIAGGLDAFYRFEKLGEGEIKTYIADDDRTPDGAGEIGNRDNDTRGRFTFRHRLDIDETSNVIAEWNYFSDEFFLQDYFEREFQREVEPESFVTYTKTTPNYTFLVDVQKRTNRFFSVIERLPEVKFTWNRREIMNTNVFYEAEHQFVNFNKKIANSSEDEDVVRADTFHEFSYPIRFHNYELVPFANFRETYFSKDKFGEENISRYVFGYGFDLSTRFYKVYDVETDFLGLEINKLRHVFEPSIRYDSIRHASVERDSMQIFDDIDDIFRKDEFIFGMEHRFQTKRYRDGAWNRVDLLSLRSFLTYSYDDDTLGASRWTKFRQEIQFRPYDWLINQTSWEYDMVSDQFQFAEVDVILEKDPIRFLLSHRFIKQDDSFGGSSLLTADLNVKLSKLWSVGGYLRMEFDSSTVEEWEIRATRDLHDWFFDFGYNERNSDIDESNKEVFVELRLKAFPQFPLKAGNRATFSRPRIGRFVSGSNESSAFNNTSSTAQY